MKTDITCMVQGRIVYTIGDLFAGETATTYGTKNPKLNKAGQQYKEYGFGLAVPKSILSQTGIGQPGEVWARLHEATQMGYPNKPIPTDFNMKWKDGDTGTLKDGTPLNTKEGYPGHIVLSLKTTIPIKFFKYEAGQYFQVNDGIKCGDYVSVQMSINVHTGTNPCLFLNPNAVLFLGYGKEIVATPSASAVFGSAPPALPEGASATPISPMGFMMPTQQAAPQFAAPPVMQQAPMTQQYQQPQAAPPVMQQQAAPTPHFGVLPQQFQQQQVAPQIPAVPGMPAFPQFTR
jgi:hypothetical protein